MDCNHARILLPFAQKRAELDATETASLQAHLDQCPECAALVRSETAFDAAVGQAMRTVPLPPGGQFRLGARLKQQRTVRRRRVAAAISAAAAMLVLAVVWGRYALRPSVNKTSVADWARAVVEPITDVAFHGGDAPEQVEKNFAERGISMQAPRNFNYAFLKSSDVAVCLGREVPKLLFAAPGRDRGVAIAEVYVLSPEQFKLDELKNELETAKDFPMPFSHFRLHVAEASDGSMLLIILQGGSLEDFLTGAEA